MWSHKGLLLGLYQLRNSSGEEPMTPGLRVLAPQISKEKEHKRLETIEMVHSKASWLCVLLVNA